MSESAENASGPAPLPGAACHDIVVIGASAGGIEALSRIVPQLPEDLPAAVFVVMHLAPEARSSLPAILARKTLLSAKSAADGERIEHGRIYVAPPDRHLLLEDGHVRLSAGPRENGHRPAIDPLFRSAARTHGPRVVGVVLSGNLDDGTLGLKAVDEHGGVTVVQDPDDALHPGMPRHAIEQGEPHHVMRASEIAALIAHFAREPVVLPQALAVAPDSFDERRVVALSCPECGGPIAEIGKGRGRRFVCRVGHSFSAASFFSEQADAVESALWTAIRVLSERSDLADRLAERLERRGGDLAARRFRTNAEDARRQAETIRRVVEDFDASAESGPGRRDIASAAKERMLAGD